MRVEEQRKDKIENVKQQSIELQKILDYKIKPQKNHTLFEYNIKDKTIEESKFDALPVLDYTQAMNGNISSKKEITKKEGFIYISALNKKNVIKVLKRDFKINI